MDINLTGKIWGMPFYLNGQETGQHQVMWNPALNINLSDFNIFNFSSQATANLNFFSFAVIISIAIIITTTLITFVTRIMQRCSKDLNYEYTFIQTVQDIYSRLWAQKILTYHYNQNYLHSFKNENYPSEDLIEKMALSYKDLLELVALAQTLFPNMVGKSVGQFDEKIRDILWTRDKDSNIYPEISKEEKDKIKELAEDIRVLDEDLKKLLNTMREEINKSTKEAAKAKRWWR